MKSQKIEIKNKIINQLLIKGKKTKSEKILLKSVKELQKSSKKSTQKIFQLALISATPIFKISTITQKKRKKKKQKSRIIPAFIANKEARISTAIKFIVTATRKKRTKSLFTMLPEEITLTAQYKSSSTETKKDIQKKAFMNKHLFKYYRWH